LVDGASTLRNESDANLIRQMTGRHGTELF
jgi:hypothetical protein